MTKEREKITIKRLKTATLADALRGMRVGECRRPPVGYSPESVKTVCSTLKRAGLRFATSKLGGEMVITRVV